MKNTKVLFSTNRKEPNICTESTQFSSAKNLFFADENEIRIIWAVIRSAVLYSA